MIFPGNSFHQKVLGILVNVFKKDGNISTFGVFGSVSKGNWDKYSDLDLDVIVKDDSIQKVDSEVKEVLSELKNSGLLVSLNFEEFKNERVIIFDNLDRISIRFHLLENTIPHILDSLKILYGNLKVEDISAVVGSKISQNDSIEILKNKFTELSIYVPIALHRNQLVNAEFFLSKMRNILIEIYVKSKDESRFFDFEKLAGKDIKEKIGTTYPKLDTLSIKKAHNELVSLFSGSLEIIGNNKIRLSEREKLILTKAVNY